MREYAWFCVVLFLKGCQFFTKSHCWGEACYVQHNMLNIPYTISKEQAIPSAGGNHKKHPPKHVVWYQRTAFTSAFKKHFDCSIHLHNIMGCKLVLQPPKQWPNNLSLSSLATPPHNVYMIFGPTTVYKHFRTSFHRKHPQTTCEKKVMKIQSSVGGFYPSSKI